jgi:hypothetical protein
MLDLQELELLSLGPKHMYELLKNRLLLCTNHSTQSIGLKIYGIIVSATRARARAHTHTRVCVCVCVCVYIYTDLPTLPILAGDFRFSALSPVLLI